MAAACALLFLLEFPWHPAPLAIRLEILSEHPARFILFYEGGSRVSEHGRISRNLAGKPTFQSVRFPIEEKALRSFRLQQWDGSSAYRVRQITIERWGGRSAPIALDRLRPFAGISALARTQSDVGILRASPFQPTDLRIRPKSTIHRSPAASLFAFLLPLLLGLVSAALIWTLTQARSSSGFALPARAWIVGLLALLYFASSFAGLNGSSSALWQLMSAHESPAAGVLLGEPQHIRSDEWLVHTPWLASQYYQEPSLPVVNPDVGEGRAPLITSLPVRHWSIIFRPQYLGFFFLPFGQAFAFYWNFKWFALLLGAFLFFDLITRGQRGLALAGAGFVLFSGFTQWWFSSPTMMPEMLAMFFFGLWSGALLLRAASHRAALGAGIVLLFAIVQFTFCCYPRFQIPLLHLALFLLVAIALRSFRRGLPQVYTHLARVTLIGGTLLVAGLILWVWFGEVRALLITIHGLIYPGRLLYTGGTFPWFWFAAPFLEFGMTEEDFPPHMYNACEASGYLFFLPLVLALVVRDACRRKFDPLLIAPAASAVFLVVFMSIGLPEAVARWTGLALVMPTRGIIGVGIASFIGIVRYLARENPVRLPFVRPSFAAFAILALVLGWIFFRANLRVEHYLSRGAVVVVSLYFALLFLLIWQRQRGIAGLLLLAPLLCAYGLVNPVSRGLPAFAQSPLWQNIRSLERTDPQAAWLVLGPPGRSNLIAQFAKSTGAHVLGGVRITPDPELLRLLDPAGKYRAVHERYAHISFLPESTATPSFELISPDSYSVRLPVGNDFIRRLGVRYLLEIMTSEKKTNIPGFAEFRVQNGIRFLRATDSLP
ncbi:MAG: DUF7657 domain-containing protein [Chthoniobacterales bacterium]